MKKHILKKINFFLKKNKKIENYFINNKSFNLKKNLKFSKEYSKIKPIISLYSSYKKIKNNIIIFKQMLNDLKIKEFAKNKINKLKKKLLKLNYKLEKKILFKKKKKNTIFLEIRQATGGDESSLFVNDLLNMYIKYSEYNNWKFKIVSYITSSIGGYKEIILQIKGENTYELLKFESGSHRVQRIPKTESQGRIHTSICTVAIILKINKNKIIKMNNSEIKIDTFKASGSGGQHVNKTNSAVRVKHIPTNLIVECQNNRSQHKNKKLALKILFSKINDLEKKKNKLKISNKRKLLIGSGDRSEKIRTYNFHKKRVTDHRINLTLYKLNSILNGDLKELINNLIIKYNKY